MVQAKTTPDITTTGNVGVTTKPDLKPLDLEDEKRKLQADTVAGIAQDEPPKQEVVLLILENELVVLEDLLLLLQSAPMLTRDVTNDVTTKYSKVFDIWLAITH